MITNLLRQSNDKSKLRSCFRAADLTRWRVVGKNRYELTPIIHSFKYKKDHILVVFTIPNGVDPQLLTKNEYVFKQYFGRNITIDGDLKKFVLKIYKSGIPDTLDYDYKKILPYVEGMHLPVICGMDITGRYVIYDMTEDPNILNGGRPGWGKSAYLRMQLTFWIEHFKPEDLRLYLGDCKASDLTLFRDVKHVERMEIDEPKIDEMLTDVVIEIEHRKRLTNKYEVTHIHQLPQNEKVPYIVVVIDEYQDLKKWDTANDNIHKIAAKGRAYGIYIILTTQRPSSDITKGIIKASLNVSMAFRTKNKLNSDIILDAGAPDASRIRTKGRMFVSLEEYVEVQVPWISADKTKKIVSRYQKIKAPNGEDITEFADVRLIEDCEQLDVNEAEEEGPLDE